MKTPIETFINRKEITTSEKESLSSEQEKDFSEDLKREKA